MGIRRSGIRLREDATAGQAHRPTTERSYIQNLVGRGVPSAPQIMNMDNIAPGGLVPPEREFKCGGVAGAICWSMSGARKDVVGVRSFLCSFFSLHAGLHKSFRSGGASPPGAFALRDITGVVGRGVPPRNAESLRAGTIPCGGNPAVRD
jgi:hypothetical protein